MKRQMDFADRGQDIDGAPRRIRGVDEHAAGRDKDMDETAVQLK